MMPDRPPRIALSARLVEIAGLLGAGWSDKQIASSLGIAEVTVKSHLQRLLVLTGARNRTAAAVWWAKRQAPSDADLERRYVEGRAVGCRDTLDGVKSHVRRLVLETKPEYLADALLRWVAESDRSAEPEPEPAEHTADQEGNRRE